MSEKILTCTDLSVGYDGREVCRGINFSLSFGDCLCVVGSSGSGRSSLLRIIMGVEKPMSGRLVYENGLTRNDIGCLPQHHDSHVTAKVRDVVMSGCLKRGILPFFTRHDRQIASERMHLTGVADVENRRLCELSGGMQQKVYLARALCSAKKLLLLDDPMRGIDKASSDEIFGLIETICMSGTMTVVMVTDDMTALSRLATHVLRLGNL